MKNISFKQYLILRRLYKAQPEPVQLDVKSKDFEYLINNKYIESEQDLMDLSGTNIVGVIGINNGLSTITNEGINIYHSYFDRYLNRTGIIYSIIFSTISIILSVISLYRTR